MLNARAVEGVVVGTEVGGTEPQKSALGGAAAGWVSVGSATPPQKSAGLLSVVVVGSGLGVFFFDFGEEAFSFAIWSWTNDPVDTTSSASASVVAASSAWRARMQALTRARASVSLVGRVGMDFIFSFVKRTAQPFLPAVVHTGRLGEACRRERRRERVVGSSVVICVLGLGWVFGLVLG